MSIADDPHEKTSLWAPPAPVLTVPVCLTAAPEEGLIFAFRASILDALPDHSDACKVVEAGLSLKLQSSCYCYRDMCCHQREAKVILPFTSGLFPLGALPVTLYITGCLGPTTPGPESKQCLSSITSPSKGLGFFLILRLDITQKV